MMGQEETINKFLQENSAYSQSKRINLCEVCKNGRIIPRYILCIRNNELISGICVSCENFELDADVFDYDHKFRCKLCIHSLYMAKNDSCKGLFCSYNKSNDSKYYWISEAKAYSCQNFKFNYKNHERMQRKS